MSGLTSQPLEWKWGTPTEFESRECWIVSAGAGPVPMHDPLLNRPAKYSGAWLTDIWYLAFVVKPFDPPKPKTVTQRQYISETREELWTDAAVAECWKPTGLTREVRQ